MARRKTKCLESFRASGSVTDSGIDLLIDTLQTAMDLLGLEHIAGYSMEKVHANDNSKMDIEVIALHIDDPNDTNKVIPYPYEIKDVNRTDLMFIASQIFRYIDSLDYDTLEAFDCVGSGYEEHGEIGWELFTPDWYSKYYGLKNYTWRIPL